MKMRLLIAIAIVFGMLTSAAAAEPPKKDARTKFYNFDEIFITGEHKKPKILYIDIRKKVKFKRLLRMRKSFLPKLLGTGKEPALR